MAICSQGWVLEKKFGLTMDLEAAQKGPKGGHCDTLNQQSTWQFGSGEQQTHIPL